MKISDGKPVVTTAELKQMCELAESLRFDHVPETNFWNEVDPGGTHNIVIYIEHRPSIDFWEMMAKAGNKHNYNFDHNNGLNIRAVALCSMKDTLEKRKVILDLDYNDFMDKLSNANAVSDGQHRTQTL